MGGVAGAGRPVAATRPSSRSSSSARCSGHSGCSFGQYAVAGRGRGTAPTGRTGAAPSGGDEALQLGRRGHRRADPHRQPAGRAARARPAPAAGVRPGVADGRTAIRDHAVRHAERPGHQHRHQPAGVQGQEEDTALAGVVHGVEPHVRLRERAQVRDAGARPDPDVPHPERDQPTWVAPVEHVRADPVGSSGATSAGSTAQCTNVRSRHAWVKTVAAVPGAATSVSPAREAHPPLCPTPDDGTPARVTAPRPE